MTSPKPAARLSEAQKYVLDPSAPFPKRWRDRAGPIRVMSEPIEGYLIVRRPGAVPFTLSVAQILNRQSHPIHGPFELVKSAGRAALKRGQE